MQVHIQNDGPVTLLLESPQFPPAKEVYNLFTLNLIAEVNRALLHEQY